MSLYPTGKAIRATSGLQRKEAEAAVKLLAQNDIWARSGGVFGMGTTTYDVIVSEDKLSKAKQVLGINPGRKHLTGGVSQKAQRAYEHIKSSLSGSRRKEIAARTVRKMIGEGKLNPSYSVQTEGRTVITTAPDKKSAIAYARLFANTHKEPIQVVWQEKDGRFRNLWVRPRKGNPSEAEEISEGFHGRKISEVLEVEEEELIPDNTAVLGCLLDITVTRDNGKTGIPIIFLRDGQKPKRGEEVYVCAPDRHNLEFVGGDQEIRGIEKLCGCDHSKQFVKLGFVESLAYLADKHHLEGSNGREEPYEHEFGKKKWLGFGKKYGMPELIYDTRNCKISLVGGTYTIEDEGITN